MGLYATERKKNHSFFPKLHLLEFCWLILFSCSHSLKRIKSKIYFSDLKIKLSPALEPDFLGTNLALTHCAEDS